MRVWRPKGVAIFRHKRAGNLDHTGPNYCCTIKSKGRTGAKVRAALMRLSPLQRDPILEDWSKGHVARLP